MSSVEDVKEPVAAVAAASDEKSADSKAVVKKEKPKKEKVASDETPVAFVHPEFHAHRIALWDKIQAEQAAIERNGVFLKLVNSRRLFIAQLYEFPHPHQSCLIPSETALFVKNLFLELDIFSLP